MTIQKAKEIDIVDYLSKSGYQPEKIVGNNYWYKSPLPNREERTASFKVNRKLNKWYDWGAGEGGNLVDLGIRLHQCSIADFLQTLAGSHAPLQQHPTTMGEPLSATAEGKRIQILSTHLISSYPLLKYLRSRRIHPDIATQYCQEVRYQIDDKTYYALGFKNDAGGYELRNQNFKGSSSPKDSTFLNNGACELVVFEGFFNFLSHRTMHHQQEEPACNFLILNSASFFEKKLAQMQTHSQVHLFLDNDKTGQKCSQRAQCLDPVKFKDESSLYQSYDDLNDWLMHIGLSPKQRLSQKL